MSIEIISVIVGHVEDLVLSVLDKGLEDKGVEYFHLTVLH